MARENEAQFLHQVLQGNADAIAFCQRIFRVSQVIDDLYDQDNPVTADMVHALAWEMLVELPSNAFYRAYFIDLQPLIRAFLLDWMDSCRLERMDSEHDRTIAFVLRDNLASIVSHCAYLIGGYPVMRAVSAGVRQFFHDETLAEYQAEFEPPPSKPKPAAKPKEKKS